MDKKLNDKSGKRKLYAYSIGIALLLIVIAAFFILPQNFSGNKSKNLALRKGVKATSDSVETDKLSAYKAIDGDDENLSSRWSSENNWENASHYIELEFPEEISVSFVVLKWERMNVISYQLEGSLDGESWEILQSFNKAPEERRQEIALSETAAVKFLRLSTNDVSRNEEDHSDLYQNVSLYEFEVYEDKPAAYYVEAPVIEVRGDGTRFLKMPDAPEGYRLVYIGADYEQVISADCEVYETIQDKEVVVGYRIESIKDSEDASEVSFTVEVPAWNNETVQKGNESVSTDGTQSANGILPINDNSSFNGAPTDSIAAINSAPQVIPQIAEWKGTDGTFEPDKSSQIIVEDAALMQTAEHFATGYREIMGYDISVNIGTKEDAKPGDFYLAYEDSGMAAGVGEEGYICNINDTCVIIGPCEQGIYWGTVTLLQILKTEEGTLPMGMIRDYPKYKVRGFGIDVARKPVSMEMLYQIVQNMSWYKMNDLSIHLNDNVILSTSGLTGSFEEALTAYSAFRIDSSVINKNGEKLTSQDYAYTAEEFAEFISMAKTYGVCVVPEIDTPAHSLSINRLFPEYALRVNNESIDQIDLSKKKAVELVKDIWREALTGVAASDSAAAFDEAASYGSIAAFDGAGIVNIGMDEYYGDGETYRKYMNEIISLVREEGGVETVRLWGSLGYMDGRTVPPVENLQMNIWSDIWADPIEMYEDGYSLINMQNNHLYIIPGGGYDYLDTEELYLNWTPNKFYDYYQVKTVPEYSPQMLGAAYMIWNDMSGSLDVGISEVDMFKRFFEPLGVISGKLWGIENADAEPLFNKLGCAPGSNPYALKVWDKDSFNLIEGIKTKQLQTEIENVEIEVSQAEAEGSKIKTSQGNENDGMITLTSNSDYIDTGYMGGNGSCHGIGCKYTISFDVYKQSQGSADNGTPEEEILFESDAPYAQTAFKAVQTGSGKVGFSREGRDYSFDYTLPDEEWITLKICGEQNQTSLYVNGKLVDTLGDAEPFSEYATFVFPLERIGSRTNSFCGMIKNIEITAD
ncbi:MAG: family 20 glycosylhydrolase [Lachnospiraceae bacterium]|nr:family 20 glycosylhydrolase [Lachnospiraceae bacterium]